MDFEAHIQSWSQTAVKMLDIRLYKAVNENIPNCYVAHSSFFAVAFQGEASVSLSGKIYPACSLRIFHGGKGTELDFLSMDVDFAFYLILYDAEVVPLKEQDCFETTYTFVPRAILPFLEKCQAMDRLWQQSSSIDKLQAQSLFLPFVYETFRQLQMSAAENSKLNLVAEAVHYIHEHYKVSITAEELAGMYNCSASYLSRLFKNQIGVGPIEYLIHIRIHKAKQLLLKSEALIQEIASSVGYTDVYYFSRLFKKHTGSSPLQFREKQKQPVQYNPCHLLKSSIVSPKLVSHNENESYYHFNREGEASMIRFSRPAFGAMMLLCTAILLSACQAVNSPNTTTSQPPATINATADNTSAETRVYEHLKGKSEIPVKPQRVVSLFHLGELMTLGVKPVGTNTFVLQNPLLSDVSGIEDVGVPPDAEKILSLDPDLIITTAPYVEIVEGGYEALNKIAPTIVVEQYNDPIKDVEMFGDILGKQEEAQKWNEAFAAKIAEYKEKIKPIITADETFSILNVRNNAFFVYGDTNMGGNIIYKYLGLKPTELVQSDVINGETWEISAEVIPDFIGDQLFLAVNEGAEESMKEVDKLIQYSPAGKAGKVYTISFDQFLPSDPISVEQQLDIIVNLLLEGN